MLLTAHPYSLLAACRLKSEQDTQRASAAAVVADLTDRKKINDRDLANIIDSKDKLLGSECLTLLKGGYRKVAVRLGYDY